MKNPFMPGDRVVCIDDDWLYDGVKVPDHDPKKGDVLIVSGVKDEWINFKEHSWDYEYINFSPAQDATEMEFEEIEFSYYQEMTA